MIQDFIDGQWVSSTGEKHVPVLNPATEEVLETCPLGTSQDVDRAVQAAKAAFPSWRKTPPQERIQYLFKMKALLEENAEELAKTVTLENGKTLVEARGSVRRAIQMVETACAIPSLMQGSLLEDIAAGIDCTATRQPLGVFAAIAPFNFPAMVPFWFWPFAVGTGNTFIIKPSERVPLTQRKIAEMVEKAGLPPGVVNFVHGGKEVVNALCSHTDVRGISFVGSTPVAKHVYQLAASHGKRVQSLGGAKNFMVVLPDADLDASCRIAYESIVGCAGERCLAGSVVTSVGSDTYTEVADRMKRLASDMIVGNGLDPHSQMGPVISQDAKDRIVTLIDQAEKDGAEVLVDGREGLPGKKGFFLKPTVLGRVKPEMEIAQVEIFGPVVCLAEAQSFDQAIEWINASPFGNTCSLFTKDGGAARKFTYEVAPSMLGINIGVPAPMSFFSFGGSKDSFFGDVKAHGKSGVEFFTDLKTTIVRWHDKSSIW